MAPGNLVRAVLSASASSSRIATTSTVNMARGIHGTTQACLSRAAAAASLSYVSRRTLSTESSSTSSPDTATSSTTPLPPQHQKTSSSTIPPPLRTYPSTLKRGTVTSIGLMDRTVRVSHRHTSYEPRIRKTYPQTTTYLVADPRNSLREGDVIEFSSGYPKSRRVRHVVERIVAPFGSGVEDRPAVMGREEREKERVERWVRKWEGRIRRRDGRDDGMEGVVEDIEKKVERVGRIKALVMERLGVLLKEKKEQKNELAAKQSV